MMEFKRNNNIPKKGNLRMVLNSFSRKQTIIFVILFLILGISAISILGKINQSITVYLPEQGGSIKEGVIGAPRFINPVLALSDTDRDLTSIIYSGLMKKNPDGSIEEDLAEYYESSEDGLTYTFTIKEGAKFHNGYNLTSDDVIFTINKIKDSTIKSPMQAIWQGISIEKVDERNIIFRLNEPYAAFLENTTIGILPKRIWEKFDSEEFNLTEFNLKAIGSGPYRIKKVNEKNNGLIESIELTNFNSAISERAYIKNIKFIFFKNEVEMIRSYRKGRVDQIGAISPVAARELEKDGFTATTATLSRIFGLFLNSNQNSLLRDKDIVKAIELAIDKDEIIENALYGYGIAIDDPIPDSIDKEESEGNENKYNKEEAERILEANGWSRGEDGFRTKDGSTLEIAVSTGDTQDLREAVEIIKQQLEDVGIKTSVRIFDAGVLNQNIIRPRDYEILFFGQIVRNESDLFAFWHSSQRNDPGLNISVYTNSKVDDLLEDLISTNDEVLKASKIEEFKSEIEKDKPAIFIYSPKFIYMEKDNVKNIELEHIISSSERLLGIKDWYIRTDAVWNFLTKQEKN